MKSTLFASASTGFMRATVFETKCVQPAFRALLCFVLPSKSGMFFPTMSGPRLHQGVGRGPGKVGSVSKHSRRVDGLVTLEVARSRRREERRVPRWRFAASIAK